MKGAPVLLPARRFQPRRLFEIFALVVPGLLLLAVGLFWPFLRMVRMSFLDKYPGETALTFSHYLQFVTDSYYLGIAARTFEMALVITVLTAVIGFPVAWYLARSESRFRHLVFLGVVSPLLVSIIVRTIGWTILLGSEGLINSILTGLGIVDEPLRLMQSFWSVVVGMVHVLLPFMVLSIASVLGKIDGSLLEAAAVHGARPIRTFTRVVLPLSIQGIAAGSVIVFCLSVGAYITPSMLGRGHVTVMSITTYDEMVGTVDWPTGAATSMILTLATLVILFAYGIVIRRNVRR